MSRLFWGNVKMMGCQARQPVAKATALPGRPWLVLWVEGGNEALDDCLRYVGVFGPRGLTDEATGSHLPPHWYTFMMNARLTRSTGEAGKQLVPCWSARLCPPHTRPGQSVSLSPLAPTHNEKESKNKRAQRKINAGGESAEQWSVWPHDAIIISNNTSWVKRERRGRDK